jgi:hypothetical protein
VSGAAAWSAAGIPVDQLVLGVAAYGHSFRVAHKDAYANGKSGALALYAPFNASAQPAGDAWDDTAGTVCPCSDRGGTSLSAFCRMSAGTTAAWAACGTSGASSKLAG